MPAKPEAAKKQPIETSNAPLLAALTRAPNSEWRDPNSGWEHFKNKIGSGPKPVGPVESMDGIQIGIRAGRPCSRDYRPSCDQARSRTIRRLGQSRQSRRPQ